MGFWENAFLRFTTALLFVPVLLFYRGQHLSSLKKALWEVLIVFALPIHFMFLYLSNSDTIYWYVSVMWSGLFYGILSGYLWFPLAVFPIGLVAGAALHSAIFGTPLELWKSAIPPSVIAWFTAWGSGLAKLAMEIFYRTSLDLQSEKNRSTGLEELARLTQEKLEIEKQLHESQKLEVIGRLASGVAHDFNNQLMAILSMCEVLSHRTRSKQFLDDLSYITTAAQRSAALTRQLLTFSRQESQQQLPLDVVSVVDEALALLRRSVDKRIGIETRFVAESTVVMGDAALLQNAVLNLGINASQAMPSGGTITVETYNGTETPPRTIMIRVSDTGTGMNEKTRGRVFEPFFTTKTTTGGTGVGLSVVHSTVKAHGGDIRCESTEGKGTIFTITLPLSANPLADETQGKAVRGKGSVVVVDDDPGVRRGICSLLELLGYSVLDFGTAAETLEHYRENHATIDLIIVDMVMPDMTGLAVLKELRAIDPAALVLLITGYSSPVTPADALKRGASGYLPKPFSIFELSTAVSDILSART